MVLEWTKICLWDPKAIRTVLVNPIRHLSNRPREEWVGQCHESEYGHWSRGARNQERLCWLVNISSNLLYQSPKLSFTSVMAQPGNSDGHCSLFYNDFHLDCYTTDGLWKRDFVWILLAESILWITGYKKRKLSVKDTDNVKGSFHSQKCVQNINPSQLYFIVLFK
jgi:hypothetical protein